MITSYDNLTIIDSHFFFEMKETMNTDVLNGVNVKLNITIHQFKIWCGSNSKEHTSINGRFSKKLVSKRYANSIVRRVAGLEEKS